MSNTAAKAKGQKHDTDLLLASNVSVFKQWLITQGVKVTEPDRQNADRGVHYWVEIPGCKPVSVQEGFGRKARYAQTHYRLRQLLNSFLTSPMASAIKDVVRVQKPGPLQVVVSGKVQPPAQAANGDVPAILQAAPRDPSMYLVAGGDIERALDIDSPIPEGVVAKDIFGVRVGGGIRPGLTVVAHMKVYDNPMQEGRGQRFVEVVDYPIHGAPGDIKQQAEYLFQRASALPEATILVDVLGHGLEFLRCLEALSSPTVKRYGMTMGNPLSKKAGGARFFNRRAECSVRAAEAIKDGALKLKHCWPTYRSHETALELFGAKLPFHFTAEARYRVGAPEESPQASSSADLFEAICLAFHSVKLPTAVEKTTQVQSDPAQAPGATSKPLDAYLVDLRDDFAVTCPLVQAEGESLTAFANRRWVYAQAMIDQRPV
ncbi:MAG: terminase protein [Pseudomonas orientalis]|nr:terminase protein [Pseudomonas orientalis]